MISSADGIMSGREKERTREMEEELARMRQKMAESDRE